MVTPAAFPGYVSFTVTNACTLRCRMCGQWSEEGYVRTGLRSREPVLALDDWKRLADEAAAHGISSILIRGGEPFLLPGIVELLEHLKKLGLFVSIDSNGTRLAEFAADLVRLGGIHVTVSVDGPEAIHDAVRGVPGTFRRLALGLARRAELDGGQPRRVSRSICFTISPWSVRGLGELPEVARQLGVDSLCIVPYYYLPASVGETWAREVHELFGREATAWKGFHHESSGVDPAEFARQHRRYQEALGELQEYPYLALTAEQYRTWFTDPTAAVGSDGCANAERLIDIQPNGDANSCVDFPDAAYGNVRQSSIATVWNSEPARRFRERRREGRLGACHRCGARYMGELRAPDGAVLPVSAVGGM